MEHFLENKKRIDEHNKLYEQGLTSYRMGLNKYSDLSTPEFNSEMNLQSVLRAREFLSRLHFWNEKNLDRN